ncbi:Putative uncharacterized protein [Moritella viscosa]|uniref:Uncharacterized protein n=1 Tax=Moritella viscosa TaxID=80854 RepID=A0A1L0DDU3_9GAMM|nr:hypothetical protein [Moritella viscosa]SGY85791.1 Putative uncharacterized protein [Moritella viscosa]SHN98271.1 Putative uncharacterized protein [Moritella viscosa]SHN98272.1 Putative uncharacterized protein [Moritella viscosa]SHN98292.1 Putative uncharacterized protein [Moritella viscosa]SHN99048.1 Putative uncharacterized protein [Moritella viscosa]
MSEKEQENINPAVPVEVDAPELAICTESYKPPQRDNETQLKD